MTKTEREIILAAYGWAWNPTDSERNKILYNAVRKDDKVVRERENRRIAKIQRNRK